MEIKIMTKAEFRKSKEYAEMVEKIRSYSKGFTFTLHYADIPKAKGNALKLVTQDCIDNKILESIEIGLDIEGNFVQETYRRL